MDVVDAIHVERVDADLPWHVPIIVSKIERGEASPAAAVDCDFFNPAAGACKYIVALVRRQA